MSILQDIQIQYDANDATKVTNNNDQFIELVTSLQKEIDVLKEVNLSLKLIINNPYLIDNNVLQ